jgi:hypothetical protein
LASPASQAQRAEQNLYWACEQDGEIVQEMTWAAPWQVLMEDVMMECLVVEDVLTVYRSCFGAWLGRAVLIWATNTND